MSQFLQNLIGRHQEADVHEEVMPLVQPRPKSRFEPASDPKPLAQTDLVERDVVLEKNQFNSDAESNLTQGLPNSRPIATSETNWSQLDTQVTTQQSNENPVIQTDSSDQIKNFNERIETLTLQLGKESPVLEAPNRATSNLNNLIVEDHPESPKMSEHLNPVNSENLFVTGELNDRIQTILHRLNNQQSPVTENSEPVTQHDHAMVEIDKYPAIEPQQHTGSISETISEPQQHTGSISETLSKFQQPDTKGKQQTIKSTNKRRSSKQTGLLQIPDWLSEMQADLNNRLQEINEKPETDPVVNVTIGRVEVKAVQSNAIKQPKMRNKPSGVMGLDDYLKQRERRGRI